MLFNFMEFKKIKIANISYASIVMVEIYFVCRLNNPTKFLHLKKLQKFYARLF